MSITIEDVLHVTQLARLTIDDTRLPGLVAELNGILLHIDALQQAAIPADLRARALAGMPLRDDAEPPVVLQRAREAFAPATRDGFFLVPRLATHGEAGASAGASADAVDAEGDA